MAEALKLRMILNLVFIGPFYGGIVEIGVFFLGLGPRKTSVCYTARLWFKEVGCI